MKLHYTKGYKYQTDTDYHFKIDLSGYLFAFWAEIIKELKFVSYNGTTGTITVKAGYAWDGPSGPTKDDKTNMRAALEHDVLYQLMRYSVVIRAFRSIADAQFNKTAKEDGMWWWRRKYYLWGLEELAGFAADPRNKKRVYVVGQ